VANRDDLSMLDNRRAQMFPVLDDADLARICRFGIRRRYASGSKLVTAGVPILTPLATMGGF